MFAPQPIAAHVRAVSNTIGLPLIAASNVSALLSSGLFSITTLIISNLLHLNIHNYY